MVNDGNATFTGVVILEDSLVNNGNLTIQSNSEFYMHGSLLNGQSGRITCRDDIYNSPIGIGNSFVNNGVLNLNSGTFTNRKDGILINNGEMNRSQSGDFIINPESEFTNNGTFTFFGYQTIEQDIDWGGQVIFDGYITTTGTVICRNGGVNKDFLIIQKSFASDGVFTNEADATINVITSFATISPAQFINQGTLVNQGILDIGVFGTLLNNGVLKGSGSLSQLGGSLTNSSPSIYAPGNSIGTLTISSGPFNLSGGKYEAELDGASSTSDAIAGVTSAMSLAGTLDVTFLTPPTVEGSYSILQASSISDQFTVVNFPTVPGYELSIEYTATEVLINVSELIVPVEMTSFAARKEGAFVALAWSTAVEIDNEGFFVERQEKESKDWVEIGFVNGIGNSQRSETYSFLDEKPSEGLNYYRLKQVDFGGRNEYSELVSLEIEGQENDITLAPNPAFNGLTYVDITGKDSGPVQIFDMNGHLVKSISAKSSHSTEKVLIDLEGMNAGNYLIAVQIGGKMIYKKLVLINQ